MLGDISNLENLYIVYGLCLGYFYPHLSVK